MDVFSIPPFLDSVRKNRRFQQQKHEKDLHNISLAIITHLLAESNRYHNLSSQVKQSY